MRCGNCKADHPTVADVRACHEHAGKTTTATVKNGPMWPASPKQIDYALGLQLERQLPDGYTMVTREDLMIMERDQVSGKITFLKSLPRSGPGVSGGRKEWAMPEGRYALRVMDAADSLKPKDMRHVEWKFYEVDKPTEGRWAGYTFIKMLIGAPGRYRKETMGKVMRDRILQMIEDNPKQAMINYGLQSGVCGRCASPLTDPDSLARGLGPICAGKSGWF